MGTNLTFLPNDMIGLIDENFRDRKIYNLYTRETIPWSLECDLNKISRQDALKKV